MKILYWYIIKKFFLTFLLIIGMFILIAIVFDFAEKIEDFVKNDAPLEAIIFQYYMNFIPVLLNLFSPLFIFIAAIYFTSRLASQTEIVAMLTNGINFYRLLIPYLFVSLVLASFTWYLNCWVIPHSIAKQQSFEAKYVLNPFRNTDNHIHRQIEPGVFIYMQSYEVSDSMGYRFSLEKFRDNNLYYKLQSHNIRWDKAKNKWVVKGYSIRTIDSMSEKLITGKELTLDISITPGDFGRKTASVQTLDNRELKEFIQKEMLRGERLTTFYFIELYRRLSMPFATFILVIIAFAMSSRKIRGGIGIYLAYGLLIAFTYIFFMQFSSVLSVKANVDPLLSTWIPNIFFSVIAAILLYRAPK
jgi:lipopolysaccharide export system permease protein